MNSMGTRAVPIFLVPQTKATPVRENTHHRKLIIAN